ncbi:SAM-dependent methyltransferase [Ningiella sp. W23]|uniref:SAM-dependent methyltransferase n=1 Tax=Ningiella sp. W23 TaxID=3023715 RepID=UPI0037568CED
MTQQAREIQSNQVAPHDNLEALVNKHKHTAFQRPIAEHTKAAFEQMLAFLSTWDSDVVIDACCGVGQSTLKLCEKHPKAKIIGIDKSLSRIEKHNHYQSTHASTAQRFDQYLIVQADLNDFWRLLSTYLHGNKKTLQWRITKQYLLYPNPYPKKSQVGKRWHASPVFPNMLECCSNIELRSNWKVFVEEFVIAMGIYALTMTCEQILLNSPNDAITPFERKYALSGQALWIGTTLDEG